MSPIDVAVVTKYQPVHNGGVGGCSRTVKEQNSVDVGVLEACHIKRCCLLYFNTDA